ncbi:NACHT domain-containing protein [Streptomyces sp. NPDC058662]|uniref:NACHT domain-containing protein n=1 Tax=Streptomyces sp. NPDC058662 TaxID=3346583 RepID=UPI003668F938
MFDVAAARIAGSVLSAGIAPAARTLVPGQGAAITHGPFFSKLRIKQPVTVEAVDIERLSRHIAKQLRDFTDREFASLPENERLAAAAVAAEAFEGSTSTIWDCDLDPQAYARSVVQRSRVLAGRSALSAAADAYLEVVVHHLSLQAIQFVTTWPSFAARVELEQLKRLRQIVSTVEGINGKLGPHLLSADLDFEHRYAGLVAETLDRLEIFGVDLKERENRGYSLTTAYITLSVSDGDQEGAYLPRPREITIDEPLSFIDDEDRPPALPDARRSGAGMRAEAAIAPHKRLLLRGDAGSGKTTLLHWLSVNCARRSLTGELAHWNTLIPFVLPLRRFAESALPTPSTFFPEVGTHLADEMPDKWVNRMLSTGRALVLVDGVDEMPAEQRESVRAWLRQLIRTYPDAHYVVTSRPAAAEADWLAKDGFAVLDMLPMTQEDVTSFIDHWHDAAREAVSDPAENLALVRGKQELVASIRENRQLRRLAANPLLCALLCTLNRDRNSQLPKDRMELYRAALDMLLLRRDRERRIKYPEPPQLGDAQKKAILGGFAYWLMRNGLTDAPEAQVINQVSISLESMFAVEATPKQVYEYLLVRSGCLRKPVEDRVDFVHRTFQEYLAAARIVEVDDLQNLLDHAHLDQWHEVVVMAVGHARPRETSSILAGLLDRGDREPGYRNRLHLLAAACLETAGECDPNVFRRVRAATARLIPPRNLTEAKELAGAGEMVIPLIPASRMAAPTAAATVRMASLVGGSAALSLISKFGRDNRVTVRREVERAWAFFDPTEFAEEVLWKNQDNWRAMHIQSTHYLPGLRGLEQLSYLVVDCLAPDLDWLPDAPGLSHLTVTREVAAPSLEPLRRCPNLKALTLFGSGLTSLQPLRLTPRLQSLSVTFYAGLVDLPPLPELDSLRIGNRTSTMRLAQVHDSAPNLTHLSTNGSITDPAELVRHQQLRSLTVPLADRVLLRTAAGLPELEHIHVRISIAELGHLIELSRSGSLTRISVQVEGTMDRPVHLDLSPFGTRPGVKISISSAPEAAVFSGLANERTLNVAYRDHYSANL